MLHDDCLTTAPTLNVDLSSAEIRGAYERVRPEMTVGQLPVGPVGRELAHFDCAVFVAASCRRSFGATVRVFERFHGRSREC